MIKRIATPLRDDVIADLRAGDRALISGFIYTCRDAGHKLLVNLAESGRELPVDLQGQVIYYAGPCPAKPGQAIGSIGPTTSGRMDPYTHVLLNLGLKGMIGKGLRSQQVKDEIVRHQAVYLAAIGGAGALLAQAVKSCEIVAFPELGPEAIHKLLVEDFPATVVLDCQGNDLYALGREKYKR